MDGLMLEGLIVMLAGFGLCVVLGLGMLVVGIKLQKENEKKKGE